MESWQSENVKLNIISESIFFQFEENEKKRIKSEQQRQENKHKKQWEDLVFRNETSLRELEQLQVN